MPPSLSPLGALARAASPTRYLASLFAPEGKREALFTVIAFDGELARARAVASQPPIALIRLQWWREVVQGVPKRHQVADPLAALLKGGSVTADDLLPMIDGHEIEADPQIETVDDWRNYLFATAGGLSAACGRVLDADEPLRARLCLTGAAYGAGRLLRAVAAMAARGRCLLPTDTLARHGLTPEAAMDAPNAQAVAAAIGELANLARTWLAEAGQGWPAAIRPAALPAVQARRDLADPMRDPVPSNRDRLALTWAGLTGRI